jgi:tetratricopeptide repeat protein 21B
LQFSSKNYRGVLNTLDTCLSLSFEVRQLSLYQFIKGRALKGLNQLDEALPILSPLIHNSSGKDSLLPSQILTVYLEIVDIYTKQNKPADADHIMQDAMRRFKDPSYQSQLILAHSDILTNQGKIDTAIQMLLSVPSSQTFFVNARHKVAELYLKHKRDESAYIRCYQELLDVQPSLVSYLHLGDAYVTLMQPDKAVAIYKAASEFFPNAVELNTKIGKALIQSHDYNKAVKYYMSNIEYAGSNQEFITQNLLELADLYLKLNKLKDAEETIIKIKGDKSLGFYKLFASIYAAKKSFQSASQLLETAL